MSEPAGAEWETVPDHCVTCGDEGVAMTVIEIREGGAVCADPDRAQQRVAVDLVAPVIPGDELLVHAGVAIRNFGASK